MTQHILTLNEIALSHTEMEIWGQDFLGQKSVFAGMSVHGTQNTVANKSIPYAYDFAPQTTILPLKVSTKIKKFKFLATSLHNCTWLYFDILNNVLVILGLES